MRTHELENLAHPETIEQPNEREVVGILWKSYELSQGSEPLQCHILERIATYFTQPITTLDSVTVREQFHHLITDDRGALRLGSTFAHKHIDAGNIQTELDKRFTELFTLLTTTPNRANLISNQTFLDKIWKRDAELIQRKSGRPNRSDGTPNTLQDPFYSTGIQYFVLGKKTNNRVFDRFLQELASTKLEELNRATLTAIQQTLQVYTNTHEQNMATTTYQQKVEQLIASKPQQDSELA